LPHYPQQWQHRRAQRYCGDPSIEVRCVIHKQTFERLPQLARFIVRNLPFVSQVVLMGLEPTGFTRANLSALWIDPVDYQAELSAAVAELNRSHVRVMIYNHPLCLLKRELWPFARRSISDWKNLYLPECDCCEARSECGGFFSSASLRHSDYVRPIRTARK
jgi:hypothetical protein